ncbi:unnamed protein product, partial [Prorocentrum cordatum]
KGGILGPGLCMALALRPRHAAAGEVGAVLLRHADLVYQTFLQQAGLWQGAGHAGAEAAAQAAYSAADAASLAAAAAAAAGEALTNWSGPLEGVSCPQAPACTCSCPKVPECPPEADGDVKEGLWHLAGGAVGHIVLVLGAPLRESRPTASAPPGVPRWQGLAALLLETGHAAVEEEFCNELLVGSYVAVFYTEDDVWHERQILFQVDAQHWVVYTPDGDMYIENVMAGDPDSGPCRAAILPADGTLPFFLRGKTYRFRDFPDEQRLLDLINEGYQLAVSEGGEVVGPTAYTDAMGQRQPLELHEGIYRRARGRPLPALPPPLEPPEGGDLLVGGTRTPEVLDADVELVNDGGRWVSLVTIGSVRRGDPVEPETGDKVLGELALHRMPNGEVIAACRPDYLSKVVDGGSAADGGDARVLAPVSYDPGGRRRCDFANAVSKMSTEPMEDFPLEGERSALWLFKYVRDHGGAFDARQTKWTTEQKIAIDSTAYLIHDLVGLALDLSVCYDQCDGGNLASVEVLARLYQLVEETNGTLQLEGLEHYVGRDPTGGLRRGVALNPGLAHYATDKKSKETEVMKQRRKAREESAAAKKASKGGGKKDQVQERTAETIRAINRLAGFDTPEVESVGELTGPSALVYSDVRALHAAHAPEPVNSISPQEAFHGLLGGTPSSYMDGDEVSPVRPYSRELVSWPKRGNRPVPLPTNAPPDLLRYMTEGQRDVWLRQPQEVAQVRQVEGLPTLYGDTVLKENRDAYIGFVKDGLARGIFRLSRRRKEAVKVFFVKKKDSSIRIVIDCRRSNQHFRAAPKVHLFSGSSFGEVEVSAHQQMWYAGGDVQNAFYQHQFPCWLQPYFGLDCVRASELGVAELDGQAVRGDQILYPLMNVVPMGWKWALFMVQRIHEHVLDGVPELGPRRRAVDFRPPPRVEDGAVHTVYVDNVLIEGFDKAEVTRLREAACAALQQAGYATHDESDAAASMEMLGVEQTGCPGRVQVSAKRYWRLWQALEWIRRRQPPLSSRQLERLIGHFTF